MKPFTSKHCGQYLTKSSPFNQNKKNKKLKEKVETARRAAFIRSNSSSEDYDPSPEEKKAQRKYDRLRKRLDRKEQK